MNSDAASDQIDVAIIGGGLAGLACATGLAGRGLRIAVFESRPRLGGRASSFVDRETGEVIDNCQHVTMGCCANFDDFCKRVGVFDLLRTQDELYFIGRDGVVNRFAATGWPAPLHLGRAFKTLSYLSRAQLKEIRRGLTALCRAGDWPGTSFANWLKDQRQSPETIERFWHVVLVSALSETPERIDFAYARKVFVDGFLKHRDGWKVRIPAVPLDDFYGDRIETWLSDRGVTVTYATAAELLQFADQRATGVQLRGGRSIDAAQIVLAVPHHSVLRLLPSSIAEMEYFRFAAQLESAPISSVHLWFDRAITDLPHAVLIERLSQWMFNRARLHQQPESSNDERRHYYQIVISASRNLSGRASDDVIAEVVAELAEVWPATRQAKLLHSRLVTEHKAVFSPLPGVDDVRPLQQSPIANLQLAGDWTATGWPSTMEGAVRSGYLAAENVLRELGKKESLLVPDLPTAFLSKWLLRL